jgi:hypothetical protein
MARQIGKSVPVLPLFFPTTGKAGWRFSHPLAGAIGLVSPVAAPAAFA